MTAITSPMLDALEEFREAARAYVADRNAGTRYALEMAAEELRLLGLNPEWVTPDGYEMPERSRDNQFICLECGLGVKADEDACCSSCGRDCLIVEGGVLRNADAVRDGILAFDGDEAAEQARAEAVEKRVAEEIAAWLETELSDDCDEAFAKLRAGAWRKPSADKEGR